LHRASESNPNNILHYRTRMLASRGTVTTVVANVRTRSNTFVTRRSVLPALHAKKREIEGAFFQDVYDGVADRVLSGGFLKRDETLLMVESIKSEEQAVKSLEVIAKHLENRTSGDYNDWPYRKKYYLRICQLLYAMNKTDAIIKIFTDSQRYQLSTYFASEVIRDLAGRGAPTPLLMRIAEITKLQRAPGDKGVKSAYAEIAYSLQKRGSEEAKADLAAVKGVLKAWYQSTRKVEKQAASSTAAVQQQPQDVLTVAA